MEKKFVVPLLVITLMLTLACSVALEGISIGDPNEPDDPISQMFAQETLDAIETEETGSAPVDATPEPEYQSVNLPGSDMEMVVAGSHEYSIDATNFECTCQATDNMTVDFNFTGNQVEITNGGGGATMVYDKIGENRYQRSVMGYYILTSGVGDQATETKVEEENITVIILTSTGYVMENYKGEADKPCCYYTFTIQQ